MEGLLKVGMINNADERTPLDRAKELYTTGVASPFEVEFEQKETILHTLLSRYTERPNPLREFFHASPEQVKEFFDLMDGEMWVDPTVVEEDEEDKEKQRGGIGRDMTKYFTDGHRISHNIIGVNEWIGTYDSARNVIVCDTICYKSLGGFVNTHLKANGRYKNKGVNAWTSDANYEVNAGEWISVSNIQPL
jgi:hypothetical protein